MAGGRGEKQLQAAMPRLGVGYEQMTHRIFHPAHERPRERTAGKGPASCTRWRITRWPGRHLRAGLRSAHWSVDPALK